MSQYTMEIRELMNNPLTPLFNFNYPFYCESEQLKKEFEEKFINHYYYHEIGCETFARWEQMLKSRLTLKMPYYKQLYETYLASKDLNFLLNKDLLETIEHTITQSSNGILQNDTSFNQQSNATTTLSNQQEGNTTQEESSTQQITSESTTSTQQQSKESRIENGVSQASLESGYLTGVSQTTGTDENQTKSNQSGTSSLTSTNEQTTSQTSSDETGMDGTSTGKQQSTNESNLTEKTTLVSQGNIGITSSAQLLKEWREVLLNMDELIINECQDLFIQIY